MGNAGKNTDNKGPLEMHDKGELDVTKKKKKNETREPRGKWVLNSI